MLAFFTPPPALSLAQPSSPVQSLPVSTDFRKGGETRGKSRGTSRRYTMAIKRQSCDFTGGLPLGDGAKVRLLSFSKERNLNVFCRPFEKKDMKGKEREREKEITFARSFSISRKSTLSFGKSRKHGWIRSEMRRWAFASRGLWIERKGRRKERTRL